MGRITRVSGKAPGSPGYAAVASAIAYKPFGPATGFTFGNGVKDTRAYDLDYRMTGLADAGNATVQKLAYVYDPANNVLDIQDKVNAANSQVYTLGTKSEYAAERASVVATGAGGSATGYDTLEGRIEAAINADQGVFKAAASAGADALSPLAWVVIAGSLLMALCCAWAISRRLAEYR